MAEMNEPVAVLGIGAMGHGMAASALRAGIPVSVCGEIAGDPRYTALLLGLGIRTLSMVPASLPRVKRRLRLLTMAEATRTARHIMEQSDERRISSLLDAAAGPA